MLHLNANFLPIWYRQLALRARKIPEIIRKDICKTAAFRLQGPPKPSGGRLVHFLYHTGTTSSTAHEVSAVNGELSAMYTVAGRFGDDPLAIIVRSHRHRYIKVQFSAEGGESSAMVTPSWQLLHATGSGILVRGAAWRKASSISPDICLLLV